MMPGFHLIVQIATALLLPVALVLLRLLVPARYPVGETTIDVDIDLRQYQRWKFYYKGLAFLITAIFAGNAYYLASILGCAYLDGLRPYRFLLEIDVKLWAVGSALFFGLAFAAMSTEYLFRLLMRDNYPAYCLLRADEDRFDTIKVNTVCAVLFLLFGLSYTLILGGYTKITDTDIQCNALFKHRASYRFADIRSMTPVMRDSCNAKLVVVMNNGKTFEIDAGNRDAVIELGRALQFIRFQQENTRGGVVTEGVR